jgi:hypothetical protein
LKANKTVLRKSSPGLKQNKCLPCYNPFLAVEQMHMKKLQEGTDYYYDPHGNVVLTEQYHLQKGYCCGHGCRHCPYNYENVPEPRRTLLVKERKHARKKQQATKE